MGTVSNDWRVKAKMPGPVVAGQSLASEDDKLGPFLLNALKRDASKCAFRYEGRGITRGEVLARTEALVADLLARGLKPGTLVAIEIVHSFELPIAMCAVQIAGGCAVPLDPALSAARRTAILDDVKPAFILRRHQCDKDGDHIVVENGASPSTAHRDLYPELAFVVYTSGSSGLPKGVMISHASYVQRMRHVTAADYTHDNDVDLAWTPSSFIGMLDDIFLPLLLQVPTVLASPAIRTDPKAFAQLVQSERISNFRTTPSLLGLLLNAGQADALSGVRLIVISGESIAPSVLTRAQSELDATLLGFYGATEVPAAAYQVYEQGVPADGKTICTPQPFVTFQVMRDLETEAVFGETGELWVAGCSIAEGYFRKPNLTAQKFVTHNGTRWYRTGDLCRQVNDQEFQILGRFDMSEVKLNGVRINLPDVARAIETLENVVSAWVSPVTSDRLQTTQMVAHLVLSPGAKLDEADLRKQLLAKLSATSVPQFFQSIKSLPLTDNGKVDAQTLLGLAKELTDAQQQHSQKEGPVSKAAGPSDDETAAIPELDIVLRGAEEVLKRDGLTGNDDFFASGGDSLSCIHFALVLSERLGSTIKSDLVANTRDFAHLADIIRDGKSHADFGARLIKDCKTAGTPVFTINAPAHYETLARNLTASGRIWNLNLFGLTHELQDKLDSFEIEDVAALFADAIEAENPDGPAHLLAYCHNACLAIETARVLQKRRGYRCSLLLIDTFFSEFLPTRYVQFMRLLKFGPQYYLHKAKRRFGMGVRKARLNSMDEDLQDELIASSTTEQAMLKRFRSLWLNYEVEPYDGSVTLFMSDEFSFNSRKSIQQLAQNGLNVRPIKGLHRSLFADSKRAGGLADQLAKELDELGSVDKVSGPEAN